MKKLFLLIVYLLPALAIAQFDFDSRYFTIDAESLPPVPEASIFFSEPKSEQGSFDLHDSPSFSGTLNSNAISTSNYYQPVDMRAVLVEPNKFIDDNYQVGSIQRQQYAFGLYESDASSGVTNIVYKEQRGLGLLEACPPFGICPRCAHYRVGRGY